MPALAEKLEAMHTIVEHRRSQRGSASNGSITNESRPARRLRECVGVLVWEEADGSETISVVGESKLAPLQMQGVLHDALYVLAHQGEEGYVSS